MKETYVPLLTTSEPSTVHTNASLPEEMLLPKNVNGIDRVIDLGDQVEQKKFFNVQAEGIESQGTHSNLGIAEPSMKESENKPLLEYKLPFQELITQGVEEDIPSNQSEQSLIQQVSSPGESMMIKATAEQRADATPTTSTTTTEAQRPKFTQRLKPTLTINQGEKLRLEVQFLADPTPMVCDLLPSWITPDQQFIFVGHLVLQNRCSHTLVCCRHRAIKRLLRLYVYCDDRENLI